MRHAFAKLAMIDAPAAALWPRRAGWWLLLGLVLLGHVVATLWVQDQMIGWGDANQPMPQRIEVAFVQVLAPAEPAPATAAAPRLPPKPRSVRAPARVASAPAGSPSPREAEAALAGEPPPQQLVPIDEAASAVREAASAVERRSAGAAVAPPDAAASVDAVAAAAPASPASSASVATPFEWPPSTRLSYVLSGNYRGEVHGNARVQWIRQGSRYQVHLDIAIGPSFAPLISRRMTSDGDLGEDGLVPRVYDESTRLPFQQTRRSTLHFTPEQVTLANGSQQPTLPGLQDSASQFVQLTWLFTNQPGLLRVGNTVTVPLALPRRVGRWVYDVIGRERLRTPVGEIDTFHLKPRLGEQRPGNELSAEVWFAPSLQYLPVRIRIQQDADTFIDMQLDAAPLQAAQAAPGADALPR